jgi:hypothetical protein
VDYFARFSSHDDVPTNREYVRGYPLHPSRPSKQVKSSHVTLNVDVDQLLLDNPLSTTTMSLYGGIKFSIGDHAELAAGSSESSGSKRPQVLGEGMSSLFDSIIPMTSQMILDLPTQSPRSRRPRNHPNQARHRQL